MCVFFLSPIYSTLSGCMHAVVALLYPFSWQHTFIPVLPGSMLDIVCCPTPFLVGLLSSSLPKLKELPVEEVSRPQKPFGGVSKTDLRPLSPKCLQIPGGSSLVDISIFQFSD